MRTETGIRENCGGGNSHEDEYRKIHDWKPQIDENADRCGNPVLCRRGVPDHSRQVTGGTNILHGGSLLRIA